MKPDVEMTVFVIPSIHPVANFAAMEFMEKNLSQGLGRSIGFDQNHSAPADEIASGFGFFIAQKFTRRFIPVSLGREPSGMAAHFRFLLPC
jgi:hypothetical protein